MANFEDLTWDDLTAWAGSRVVARGKSYRGNVEDLSVTAAEADDEWFEELADFEDNDEDADVPATKPAKKEDEVDAYLARLSKDELLKVVQKALWEVPALRKRLADRTHRRINRFVAARGGGHAVLRSVGRPPVVAGLGR